MIRAERELQANLLSDVAVTIEMFYHLTAFFVGLRTSRFNLKILDSLRAEPSMEIGSTITHYRILELLGGGAMGVVYKAEDTRLRRAVALKFLVPQFTHNPEAKERFCQEAVQASALDHPNIGTIFEIDSVDNQLFIAMAYYEGETLKAKLARGPLAVEESIHVAVEVAKGLAKAHQQKIIHRDIKPANIMVTSGGGVKIVDFGLAKLIEITGNTVDTLPGVILGTIAYMSPEQALGNAVDNRTDIWALGVVLYEMLCGQLPFKGERPQAILHSILNDNPEPIAGSVSPFRDRLQRIVSKALQKDLSRRYQHMHQLLDDLQEAQILETRPTINIPAPEKIADPLWRQFLNDPRSKRTFHNFLFCLTAAVLLLALVKVFVADHFRHAGFFSFLVVLAIAGVCSGTLASFFHGVQRTRASKIVESSLLFAILVISCVISLGILRTNPDPKGEPPSGSSIFRPTSVAVLYFDNNTGDHGLDWLRKTIPDILIAALAQSKYVRVITPDRLLDLAADMGVDTERGLERQTAVAIARRANVQAMITGSVIRAGAQFRILAQIQDSHGSLIKTEQIEGSGTDSLLGLADELSSRIKVSMEISAHGVPSAAEGISQTRTTSLEAYNYYVSGRDKLHKRRYADAISDLRKAIQSDAGFAVAYELLANAYYILGEQSLAEETSQKAVQFSTKLPRTEQLRILRRNAQVRGDLDAELTFLHELEALQPDEAEWHFLLGWHYSTHKRAYEKSVFQYKRAIGIDPEGEPRYHAYLTTTYLMAGNRGEALAACRKYVSLLPNDAISHSRLGKVHILTGDYDAALHEFNKARELQPDFFDTSSGLGDLYCAKGMYQEALKYYRNSVAQAISKNQERDGHVLLAAAYLDVNEVNRASEESKRALELASKDLKTHWIAGLIAMRKGELHAAEAAADKMRDLLRKSHSSYQAEYLHDLKAKISLARQDFEGAIGECVQANALGPEDHAYFRHALADAYFHKRELGGAIQELENALRFNPSYAPAHYMLGRIHEQEGKRTEALAEYQLCLRILKNADPGFPLIGGLKEGVARLAKRM